MRKPLALGLLLVTAAAVMTAATAGAPKQTQAMAFRSFTIEGKSLQGALQGPWVWTGSVTLEGSGLTMTCETLKLWLTPDARDADRVEATGSIRIRGHYLGADKTEWDVRGQADSATYDRKAGQGILQGSVGFRARNLSTGAEVSAAAEKLTYDIKTKRFRFERGDRPVRMDWQESQPEAQPGGTSEAKPGQESADQG